MRSFCGPILQARHQPDIALHSEMGEQSHFLYHIANAAAQSNGIGIRRGASLHQNLSLRGFEKPVDEL